MQLADKRVAVPVLPDVASEVMRMANDPNVLALYTATDLQSVSINKPQCK